MEVARLTPFDLMFLRLESADWPCHYGGLAVMDGTALLDASGRLRLAEVRDRLYRRVAKVPQLRRRIHDPGPLRGRPVWVDDDRFDIGKHVNEAGVAAPGGDEQLLQAVDHLYGRLVDRNRPLWEMWFLTGLADGRIGVLLKLHHAMADGLAAVAIVLSLLDLEADAPDPSPAPWQPQPPPGNWKLLVDGVAGRMRTLRRGAAAAKHPLDLARRAGFAALVVRRYLGAKPAPRTSLNQPVRAGRRIAYLRLDLQDMKEVAHAHGGKVNDVVVNLWAGGLRELMVSRGEPVTGVELVTALAASLRPNTSEAQTVDNRVGGLVLRLPVWEPNAQRRLDLVVDVTRRSKSEQRPVAVMGPMVGLAATPLGRYFVVHQRTSNLVTTNVIGPNRPVYLLGAPVREILPIIELIGNIGLTLCAFSYAGEMFLVVTADASAFDDLDVAMAAMEREWDALLMCSPGSPDQPAASPTGGSRRS